MKWYIAVVVGNGLARCFSYQTAEAKPKTEHEAFLKSRGVVLNCGSRLLLSSFDSETESEAYWKQTNYRIKAARFFLRR